MTNSENIVQELKNINYNLERICLALLCLAGEEKESVFAYWIKNDNGIIAVNPYVKGLMKVFGFSEDALNEVINHE